MAEVTPTRPDHVVVNMEESGDRSADLPVSMEDRVVQHVTGGRCSLSCCRYTTDIVCAIIAGVAGLGSGVSLGLNWTGVLQISAEASPAVFACFVVSCIAFGYLVDRIRFGGPNDRYEKLNEAHGKLNEAHGKLIEEHRVTVANLGAKNEEYGTLNGQHEALLGDLEAKNTQYDQLNKDHAQFVEEQRKLSLESKEQLQKQQEQIATRETLIVEQAGQITQLEEAVKGLNVTIEGHQRANEDQRVENERLGKQITALSGQVATFTHNNSEQAKQIKELTGEIEKLGDANNSLQHNLAKLEAERQSLADQVARLQSATVALTQGVAGVDKIKAETAKMFEKQKELHAQEVATQKERDQLQEEQKDLTRKLRELQKKQEEMQRQLAEQVDDLEDAVDGLEDGVDGKKKLNEE